MNPEDTLRHLADIVPPAAPAWPNEWLAAALIAASPLALTCAIWFFKRRSRGPHTPLSTVPRAETQLTAIENDWRAGRTGGRETAYRIACTLRLGLGLRQLRELSAQTPGHSQTLLTQLDAARYAQEECVLPEELFAQARKCLRAARETSD